jgi:hypothetical protein
VGELANVRLSDPDDRDTRAGLGILWYSLPKQNIERLQLQSLKHAGLPHHQKHREHTAGDGEADKPWHPELLLARDHSGEYIRANSQSADTAPNRMDACSDPQRRP